MRYYIIAGEASGDLHGSNFINELKKLDANAAIRCWGGDKMEATGAALVKHYKDLAFMGFSEVLKNLPTIFKNLAYCKRDIAQYEPDVVLLIDYPGFNLRIAKWAKLNHFKVIYYISPQVWAWKESRVNIIKKYVDKMLVILPFEKEFYKKWNYEVEYVGHPLIEIIENFKKLGTDQKLITDIQRMADNKPELENTGKQLTGSNLKQETGTSIPSQNIIALLPGSRKQELKIKLPVMLKVAEYFPAYRFVVAKAPGLDDDFYHPYLESYENVETVSQQTYLLLMHAKAALVTSGTATLETALFKVPEIVCYKGNALSYQLAKRLIKVKYISLVNLIMQKEVVKELIQDDLTTQNLKAALEEILFEKSVRKKIEADYAELQQILQLGGNASFNAATSVFNFLQN